jgi:hypothetical protein
MTSSQTFCHFSAPHAWLRFRIFSSHNSTPGVGMYEGQNPLLHAKHMTSARGGVLVSFCLLHEVVILGSLFSIERLICLEGVQLLTTWSTLTWGAMTV